MFRYFMANFLLFSVAVLVSVLMRFFVPAIAILEQQMVDLIISGNTIEFKRMLPIMAIVVSVSALLYFFEAIVQKKFQVRLEESIRNDLYRNVMCLNLVKFCEKDTSEYMSYIKTYASTISNNLAVPIFALIGHGLMGVLVLCVMFYYNHVLAFVSVLCALFSIILPLFFNHRLSSSVRQKLKADASMTFQLKESLNSQQTVSIFGTLRCMKERFFQSSHELTKADYKMQVSVSMVQNIAQVVQKIVWFIAFLVAGGMAAQGKITVGTMIMFITLFGEFNSCVILFSQTIPILYSIRPDLKKMVQDMNERETVPVGKISPTFESAITIRNLSFRYSDEISLLKHLNVTIHKNEKVALIGSSGSGKSTLIKLLCGYYGDYTGSIHYDDTELRNIDWKQLHKLLTVVNQNAFMFHDTIRFNICMGESFSEEELQNALLKSGVEKFLADIPEGVDGDCGENGALLSGGQRQRIILARSFIRNIHFLIMDESFSAIDVETANEIEAELLNTRDLTLITVTHRIKDSLIKNYDRILQMENGKLVEKKRA